MSKPEIRYFSNYTNWTGSTFVVGALRYGWIDPGGSSALLTAIKEEDYQSR